MRIRYLLPLLIVCGCLASCGNKPTQLQLPETTPEQTTQSTPAEG